MSVVGKREILSRLMDKSPHESTSLVITPLEWNLEKGEPNGLDEDAVDVRLGSRFLVPRGHFCESLSFPKDEPKNYYKSTESIEIPFDKDIIIPAHGTVLGCTLEYLKVPIDMAGQVLTRSSLARRFVTIASAPWIHPLYRGCLTLELANAGSTAVRLKVGAAIAQLVLSYVHPPPILAEGNEDMIENVYCGPTSPELPIEPTGA